MGMKALAEAIILQTMEDINDNKHRAESMEFFSGDGYGVCSRMARMSSEEDIRVLELVNSIARISDSHVPVIKARVTARHRGHGQALGVHA